MGMEQTASGSPTPSHDSGSGTAPAWLVWTTLALTVVLAAYIAGWAGGVWSIRWEELLAELTLATFAYWLLLFFEMRKGKAKGLAKEATIAGSPWLKWPAEAFPTLLAVLVIRAVTVEPFSIPSESMLPTLAIGDQVVVNKFSYGIKVPVLDFKLLSTGSPARGDVVVFRSPMDPKDDWIKRVVGIPGDTVTFQNQRLYVNGQPEVPSETVGTQAGEQTLVATDGNVTHRIAVDASLTPNYIERKGTFPLSENCDMTVDSITCVVPRGNYFVMGDNRDHSEDSRRWGFVPDRNLVGKASMVWYSKSGTKTGWIK